jgi:pSer/pThr/pTyr-binding forkhead associated (FHA) protein
MQERAISNPVVLTGDIHSNWANELRVDDRLTDSAVVASEFVATSLSSGGNGKREPAYLSELLANNPGVKFHNEERGYIRCHVTPKSWQSDYVVVSDVTVSKFHAFVRDVEGQQLLQDAGSHNGTFVNNTRIAARKAGDPVVLRVTKLGDVPADSPLGRRTENVRVQLSAGRFQESASLCRR